MKMLLIFFALLLGASVSQTPEESPELKEAAALTESVVKLAKERKFDEALAPAKRALEIRERLLPPNDPRVITSLSYLADVYRARRDYGPAKDLLQRLLRIQEEHLGPTDVALSRTIERLALIHLSDGDPGKAEGEYKRALQLKEKALGPDHLEVADTLVGLATVYRARNNFERGAPLFKRALTIYAQLSGVNSPAFNQTSEGFSCLAHETDNRDAVKDLDEIWKRFAPPGSPSESPYTTLNAKALSLPRPEYPAEAKFRRVSGTVIMKVRIDEEGRVINIRDMCQGPPLLSPAAVAAARNAKFSPATLNGKAVQVDGIIAYRFVAQ